MAWWRGPPGSCSCSCSLACRQVCAGERRRSLLGSDRHHFHCGEGRGAPYRHLLCKKGFRGMRGGGGHGVKSKECMVMTSRFSERNYFPNTVLLLNICCSYACAHRRCSCNTVEDGSSSVAWSSKYTKCRCRVMGRGRHCNSCKSSSSCCCSSRTSESGCGSIRERSGNNTICAARCVCFWEFDAASEFLACALGATPGVWRWCRPSAAECMQVA